MSRKLSTIRVADVRHTLDRRVDPPERRVVLLRRGRDRRRRLAEAHPHQPVALVAVVRARGGRAAARGTPSVADGTRTQRPSSPNVQPWYGHDRQPSIDRARDSGASRCGQRSAAATTARRRRATARGRAPAAARAARRAAGDLDAAGHGVPCVDERGVRGEHAEAAVRRHRPDATDGPAPWPRGARHAKLGRGSRSAVWGAPWACWTT